MTFPATPESVRTARRFVHERIEDCPAAVAENALLLTSELCTNCVVHARTDYVLRVHVEGDAVRIEVCDEDPVLPTVTQRGRGMRLVDELAAAWGADPIGATGKVVWFELGS
jgi:anti-sigma regulatory factor (Ser/Thr protein kinase)